MRGQKTIPTERQLEILQLAAHGLGINAITRRLGMTSTKCIKQQLDAVTRKLGAVDVQDAVARGYQLGYLEQR